MNEKDIIIFVLIQMILIFAAIPLIMQIVKPNRFYGFRTSKTLSDETIWYKANRFAGICLLLSAIVSEVGFFALYKFQIITDFKHLLNISIIPPLLLSVFISFIYLKKI